MHRVGSTGNATNASRPRKERRLTYVLSDLNDSKHCSGVNCLRIPHSPLPDGSSSDVLFSGSRDGTLKRWGLSEDAAVCCATFESHVDWVNDAVLIGLDTLVSCSSDTTIKTWRPFSEGVCTRTFRQHTDYVTSLAAGKHSNKVASGGLGGEVFVWDLEAAAIPVSKAANESSEVSTYERSLSSGASGHLVINDRSPNSNYSSAAPNAGPLQGYTPIFAKGHKESVYALAMNDTGTILVSGGTEKAVRVWDPRSGAKQMKLKGHTDNIRALILDQNGRFCLSGSSDSMIRLWDIGQQRCVHSYAVHTDSVWALVSTPSFSHVFSGGRDLSVYLTDLNSRESTLICVEDYPVLFMALQGDDWLWVATSDSSICKWPTKEQSPIKNLQRASTFVAGTLPFARARACLEGSSPVPLNTEPAFVIPGTAGIVQHAVLNDRRHVLTKDAAGVVKLWEITQGAVINDFGKVSFEEKEKELFEMVTVPAWFTMDTRLGSISVHLDTPQCFSAEMYALDLQVLGASEEQKINLGQETLRGLFSPWLADRRKRSLVQAVPNGDLLVVPDSRHNNHVGGKGAMADSENHRSMVLPAFQFSTSAPPSIITEGSQGGPWRKKITDLEGTEDEKDLPSWIIDCLLHGRFPVREHAKCSFYLQPYEGTIIQVQTQGKLSAPRILRIQKVINYVLEKMVLDKPLDDSSSDAAASSGHGGSQSHTSNGTGFRPGMRVWQLKTKPEIEILCNHQVLPPDMSLATVRQYVWKKPEDLCLCYRLLPSR